MDELYGEQIIDHYKNPRHWGEVGDADVVTREANASCGDLVQISLKFRNKQQTTNGKQIIGEIKFKGEGCAISMAAGSLLLEKIQGMGVGVGEIVEMTEKDMIEIVGIKVTATRMKCLMLALGALQKGLR